MGCLYTRWPWQSLLQPDSTNHVASVSTTQSTMLRERQKEPPEAETDVHADYTVPIVNGKTISSESVTPKRVIAAMGGLIAIELMLGLRKRRSYILIRGLIDVTSTSHFITMVTNYTSLPILS